MIYKKIEQYIKTHIEPGLYPSGQTDSVLVGLSGGPDSVFLLYFIKNLSDKKKIKLTAVHLNHGWRDSANDDEIFCKKLCQKLSIPFFSKKAQDLNLKIKSNGSKEELGRKLRRHFFEQAKEKFNADYIALAHHQQDQQETFFIRLLRGCSLSGLTAIKPVKGFYIRPLLSISKKEILDFLHENKIKYRNDETNKSNDFLRNRIRNKIIPAIKQVDPRFDQKFISSLNELENENKFLQKLTNDALKNVFTKNIGDKQKFANLENVLKKRLIIEWLKKSAVPFTPSTGFLQEIIRFLSSDRGGTHKIHELWEVKKQRKNFWIEKV